MDFPITYIIADDDPIYRELTIQLLQSMPGLTCVAACENSIEAELQLNKFSPDLLILDIRMPGLNGIQFAQSLQTIPLIIFITSHPSYAADAFDIDAVDYLIKPVLPERLTKSINKVKALLQIKHSLKLQEDLKIVNDQSFFIKNKQSFIKINYSNVLYIESLGDFVNIVLENGQKKIALVSMINLEQQLPTNNFVRISRTHIINKEKITSIETTMLHLDKIELNIGKTYSANVLKEVLANTVVKRFI